MAKETQKTKQKTHMIAQSLINPNFNAYKIGSLCQEPRYCRFTTNVSALGPIGTTFGSGTPGPAAPLPFDMHLKKSKINQLIVLESDVVYYIDTCGLTCLLPEQTLVISASVQPDLGILGLSCIACVLHVPVASGPLALLVCTMGHNRCCVVDPNQDSKILFDGVIPPPTGCTNRAYCHCPLIISIFCKNLCFCPAFILFSVRGGACQLVFGWYFAIANDFVSNGRGSGNSPICVQRRCFAASDCF